jgi:hypothetical protein
LTLKTPARRFQGLDRGVGASRWRSRSRQGDHDLAITLAPGGDHLSDVAQLRAEPAVLGVVASDPTVSRVIDALAAPQGP